MEDHGRDTEPWKRLGLTLPPPHIPAIRNLTIKVAMPVTTGGDTGSRGEWEERTSDFIVSGTREHVVLTASDGRQIALSLNNLEAALAVLRGNR